VPLDLGVQVGNSGRKGCLDVGFSLCTAPTFYRSPSIWMYLGSHELRLGSLIVMSLSTSGTQVRGLLSNSSTEG